MKIDKVHVYGLDESIAASKYPKSVEVESCTSEMTPTVQKLGACPTGTGHDTFLNGVVVQFDLSFSIEAWAQAERYHWFEFVSSQSKMHRICGFDPKKQCNKYVDEKAIVLLNQMIEKYNADKTDENYLRVIYNAPLGFELTARMTTNYRQLKTIYYQRRYHRLPEWKAFCAWIETLPMFKELILNDSAKKSLKDFTIEELVEELRSREGVKAYSCASETMYDFAVYGPSVVLEVPA